MVSLLVLGATLVVLVLYALRRPRPDPLRLSRNAVARQRREQHRNRDHRLPP